MIAAWIGVIVAAIVALGTLAAAIGAWRAALAGDRRTQRALAEVLAELERQRGGR